MAKQGKSVFGVEVKVVDDNGCTLPRDAKSQGQVMVRGQWTVSGYYKVEQSALIDGWSADGRYRDHRCRGNPADQGSGQRPHQDRRRVDQLDRFGSRRHGASAVAMAAVVGVRHPKWEDGRCSSSCASRTMHSVRRNFRRFSLRTRCEMVDTGCGHLPGCTAGPAERERCRGQALREKYGNHFCYVLRGRVCGE